MLYYVTRYGREIDKGCQGINLKEIDLIRDGGRGDGGMGGWGRDEANI